MFENSFAGKRLALLLALCASTWSVMTGGANAQGVVKVSAAHTHELAGPLKFQTAFSHIAKLDSPAVGGNSADGVIEFEKKSATNPGGRMQITFKDVKAQFKGECVVGNSGQVFEVTLSDTVGDAVQHLVQTSNRTGADAVFTFQENPMRAQGDYVIIITSDTAAQDWNLYRCDITATAETRPKPPVDVKVQ
jgi:uncharacterized protein YbjQ (UPF0145 family)